jgi:hypothetical protein
MTQCNEHPQDVFVGADGSEEYRDPWVVDSDDQLGGSHSGSICVHGGANFEIARGAHHSGSLSFQMGSSGRIIGRHSGSLYLGEQSNVEVVGDQSGTVNVDPGAVLKVAPGGKLAGTLHVAGLIENRGVRGGTVQADGGGEVRDVDGGVVKPPTSMRDGRAIYRW